MSRECPQRSRPPIRAWLLGWLCSVQNGSRAVAWASLSDWRCAPVVQHGAPAPAWAVFLPLDLAGL
eukprot:230873-Pyramimonas_sp.AAC.1